MKWRWICLSSLSDWILSFHISHGSFQVICITIVVSQTQVFTYIFRWRPILPIRLSLTAANQEAWWFIPPAGTRLANNHLCKLLGCRLIAVKIWPRVMYKRRYYFNNTEFGSLKGQHHEKCMAVFSYGGVDFGLTSNRWSAKWSYTVFSWFSIKELQLLLLMPLCCCGCSAPCL